VYPFTIKSLLLPAEGKKLHLSLLSNLLCFHFLSVWFMLLCVTVLWACYFGVISSRQTVFMPC